MEIRTGKKKQHSLNLRYQKNPGGEADAGSKGQKGTLQVRKKEKENA